MEKGSEEETQEILILLFLTGLILLAIIVSIKAYFDCKKSNVIEEEFSKKTH